MAVPWQFLRFNLLQGASAQYGGHPWHWNLSQGLPAVTASLLPLLVAGLLMAGRGVARRAPGMVAVARPGCSSSCMAPGRCLWHPGHMPSCLPSCLPPFPRHRQPALLAAWSLASYSLPAHKEFRFLLPAMQLLMPYCGAAAAALLGSGKRAAGGGSGPARLWRWAGMACLLLQLPMAAYFVLVHQG